ncbi:type II secretion system F family protein [bacterium]|nr:type II secretion system F family protein [bacterium]
MPTYLYRAVDLESQKQVEGSIEAQDDREARGALRSRGILPLHMAPLEGEAPAPAWLTRVVEIATYRPVKGGELSIFIQQLAALIDAGLPIVEVMVILEDQVSNPTLRAAIAEIRKDLLGGTMLSEALARHPRVFSPLFVNLAQAGEVSGALSIMLSRLAETTEKNLEIERKVRSALTYPAILAVTLCLVVGVMMAFVVPTFETMYQKAHNQLPIPTQILLGISHGLREHGGMVLLFVVFVGMAYTWFSRTEVGRLLVDRLWLRLPVIGQLMVEQSANTFTRAFATVYGAGIPIIGALDNCRRIVRNQAIHDVLAQAEEGVKAGNSLSSGLIGTPYFPRVLAQMIAVGESSGRIEELAAKGVSFSDREIDFKIKQLTAMMEPAMTIVMGLIVGFIALALYLPMFDLPSLLKN